MGRYITDQGLAQLDLYKYKPGQATPIDNALQPYWNYMITLMPMWIAPNLITFIGWLVFLSSTVIIFCYDFTFKKDIPSWCFYYAAVSLWVYSTLDAIDGKQARRTQSSSALGQLFDHGCDSFCVSFLLINMGQAAKMQDEHIMVLYFSAYTAYWIANWKEYNTGVLLTNAGGFFGVTECQLLDIWMFMMSGIFGQQIWKFSLYDFMPAVVLNNSPKLLTMFLKIEFGGMVCYFFGIFIFGYTMYELVKTLWETKSLKSLKECFSLFVLIVSCWVWMKFTFFKENIGIILFCFGMMIALLVCKMIISSVTKMKLETFHKELIPLMVTTVGMAFLEYFKMQKGQFFVFWLFFISIVVMSILFLSKAIEELAGHLHIYCFSLKKRPTHPYYTKNQ